MPKDVAMLGWTLLVPKDTIATEKHVSLPQFQEEHNTPVFLTKITTSYTRKCRKQKIMLGTIPDVVVILPYLPQLQEQHKDLRKDANNQKTYSYMFHCEELYILHLQNKFYHR